MEFRTYPFRGFLVNMLRNFVNLLDKHEIMYTACGGTLLGAVRDKGFISHDYDCDIDILPQSRADFFALLCYIDATPQLGIHVDYRLPMCVKLAPLVPQEVVDFMGFNKVAPNPTIDCFMLYKRGEEYHIEGDKWPTWYYGKEELLPLRRVYFEDFSMWGPASHKILGRFYGDWQTPNMWPWPENSKG